MEDGDVEMSGKVCLVTGATSGLGEATALSLASMGATVIGVGRNPKRCREALIRIKEAVADASIEFFLADLSSQQEIRHLAKQFKDQYQRLDVLVNNAGAKFSTRLVSADGYEMTFALNHLGYFLLTNLLLDEVKRSGHGRIINVTSGAHWQCASIDFDDLHSERRYSGREAYAQSKLANLLFTYELDRRLQGTGVTVNAADPGNVITRFGANNGLLGWARHVVGSIRSGNVVGPMEGAETSIYLASSPEAAGISGKCFYDKEAVASSKVSYDTAAARRLWEVSTELTSLSPTGPPTGG